jgi:hypothetical protein
MSQIHVMNKHTHNFTMMFDLIPATKMYRSSSYAETRPYRISTKAALIAVVAIATCHAFSLSSQRPSTVTNARSSQQLYSVGNWISGITNTPPSSSLLSSSSSSSTSLIQSLTDNTSLQGKDLARIYKGSKDGWSAVDFHKCVDGKGSCLVVALTRSGILLGGYNPNGWRSTDDYYNTNAAFLWYERSNDQVIKCPVLTGGECVVNNEK